MAWVVLGLLILLLVVPLAWILLKDDPAELGLLPDGDPQPVHGTQTVPVRPGPLEIEHWQQSFRSTPIWQLCGGYFVCGFTIALISTHFVPFAIERGVSPATAATAYGLMSGLNVVGVLAGMRAAGARIYWDSFMPCAAVPTSHSCSPLVPGACGALSSSWVFPGGRRCR